MWWRRISKTWPTSWAADVVARRPRTPDDAMGGGDPTSSDLQHIEQVLQTYFDGLFERDTPKACACLPARRAPVQLRGRQAGRHLAGTMVRAGEGPAIGAEPRPAAARLGGADRPRRSAPGVRHGALPNPATLFHRLTDARDVGGGADDRVEVVSHGDTMTDAVILPPLEGVG